MGVSRTMKSRGVTVQQVYLLSVMLNLVGGLALLAPRVKDQNVRTLAQKPALRVTVGVLALLTGVAKLVLTAPLEEVPVAGDLLPALAGMAIGAVLIGDVYATRKAGAETEEGESPRKNLLLRVPVAVIAIAAAVAHFLFPAAVIL
jgi:hypothetical protein